MNWIIAIFLFHSVLCSLRLWKQKVFSPTKSVLKNNGTPWGRIPLSACAKVWLIKLAQKSTFFPFDFHLIFSLKGKPQGRQQRSSESKQNSNQLPSASPHNIIISRWCVPIQVGRSGCIYSLAALCPHLRAQEYYGSLFLKLECDFRSPGHLVEMQIPVQWVWGGIRDLACLTKPLGMLWPLVPAWTLEKWEGGLIL